MIAAANRRKYGIITTSKGKEVAMSEKLKVYCESSFWSYLTGRRTADEKIARSQAFTLKWWEDIATRREVCVSEFGL
jgi:hypothetical protein